MGGLTPQPIPTIALDEANPLRPPKDRTRLAILLAAFIFSALSLLAAILSKGFLEADACTHYVYARFAFSEPHLFTNVWGRPFCTAVYALPALIGGRLAVRVMSLILALITAAICYRIAKGQGLRHPALAFIFLLAQPLVFLHSFSELTELPFAFLMAAAFWAYQEKRWPLVAIFTGLMPTARPEGFGFIILAALALVLHRRARLIALLLLPLTLWSAVGWFQHEMLRPAWLRILLWIPEHWPYSTSSAYDSGPLLFFKTQPGGETATSFLVRLPAAVSPFVFPALLIGFWLCLRDADLKSQISNLKSQISNRKFFFPRCPSCQHRRLCGLLIAWIPLAILAGHSFLYWRGKMASSGELRYMLVVAPFWALLGAIGWEWAFWRARLHRPLLWAGIAALLPIYVNKLWMVVPIQLSVDWKRANEVAYWVRHDPPWRAEDYPLFMATHTSLYYFLDISTSDKSKAAEWHRKTILNPPNGVAFVWDSLYGNFNSDRDRAMSAEDIAQHGWVPIHVFPRQERSLTHHGAVGKFAASIQKDDVGDWIIFLSPRDKHGNPTHSSRAVPLPTTRPATLPVE